MSDIRKFINIVESIFEDEPSNVEKTDIEASDDKKSKMSNSKRANVALYYLIQLDRFIRYAKLAGEPLTPRNTFLREFEDRADSFIEETKDIIEKISKIPYEGPNESYDIEASFSLVKPYSPNIKFRNQLAQFAAPEDSDIEDLLRAINRGIKLIAGPYSYGLLISTKDLVNNKFRDLRDSWPRISEDLKRDLEKISNP